MHTEPASTLAPLKCNVVGSRPYLATRALIEMGRRGKVLAMTVELENVIKIDDPAGFTYYLGTLTPKKIKELTFVPVVAKSATAGMTTALNEREEHGYQRAGDPKRMEKIREFVKENPACIIPPVLLSARGTWKFHPVSGKSHLGKLEAEELAAIVDGQHRLGGLWLLAIDADADDSLKRRPIPFMLIDDMAVETEQENFININDTQQGVKKSLLKYLQRDERFIGQAAHALMEDEESVFCGRIEIQKKDDAALVLFGAIVDCVALTFGKDFESVTKFHPEDSNETKSKAISFLLQYWKLVSTCMPAFWADMAKMPPVGGPKSKEYPGTRAFECKRCSDRIFIGGS